MTIQHAEIYVTKPTNSCSIDVLERYTLFLEEDSSPIFSRIFSTAFLEYKHLRFTKQPSMVIPNNVLATTSMYSKTKEFRMNLLAFPREELLTFDLTYSLQGWLSSNVNGSQLTFGFNVDMARILLDTTGVVSAQFYFEDASASQLFPTTAYPIVGRFVVTKSPTHVGVIKNLLPDRYDYGIAVTTPVVYEECLALASEQIKERAADEAVVVPADTSLSNRVIFLIIAAIIAALVGLISGTVVLGRMVTRWMRRRKPRPDTVELEHLEVDESTTTVDAADA
jgi:hypothetical protein